MYFQINNRMSHTSGQMVKDEYHANENPLKMSEINNICWSKINVSNNQKNIIPHHASFFLMPLSFYVFTLKIVVFN